MEEKTLSLAMRRTETIPRVQTSKRQIRCVVHYQYRPLNALQARHRRI